MRSTWILGLVLLALASSCGGDEGGGSPDEDGGSSGTDGASPDAGPGACAFDDDCVDGLFCNGVEYCDPSDSEADERGCVQPGAPCTDDEMCDEDTDRCRVACAVEPDMDGDGYVAEVCGGDDCDDMDPTRFTGNVEVCDAEGHDEDCNAETVGFVDADGDGAGSAACCNGTECGPDCDDTNASIGPGRP